MTTLEAHNPTDRPVLVYLTLGATPGCVQDVSAITFTPAVSLNVIAPLMGSFTLTANQTVQIAAPDNLGLNGNLSFGTPPLNCPCPDWPNDVALAEFIINNGFQPNGQETIDISCVAGSNAYLGFDLSAGDWTTNGGAISVSQVRNSTRYRNTGLVGVFPYGCDNCTSSDSPPSCVGKQPQFVQAAPICNVQRSAAANQGGVVKVSFLGWTPVPLSTEQSFNLVRRALVGLVGVDTEVELDQMESIMRAAPAPEADKVPILNAIHALKSTL
jgi:hypothetical protein